MFIFLPAIFVVGIIFCIASYCKSQRLKNNETQVSNVTNRGNHVNGRSPESRTDTAICIVPTTNQVMEIFNVQASAAAINNRTETSMKPPPSYGTVIVDEPPSYEKAVEQLDNSIK